MVSQCGQGGPEPESDTGPRDCSWSPEEVGMKG